METGASIRVPDLCVFMTPHMSVTPYSFGFHKRSDVSCCSVKFSPSQFQVPVMQRQPIPRLDKDLEGHFVSRSDAQARILGKGAFTDLEDLPSNAVDTRKAGAKLKVRRIKMLVMLLVLETGKEAGLCVHKVL